MPKILVGKSHLFVCNGLAIAAFNLKVKEDIAILEIPWISLTVNESRQSGSGQQSLAVGNENDMYDDDVTEFNRDPTSSCILQISICKCGYHLAACNEQKQLAVWDVSNNFEVVCIRSVPRKALCVCFMADCKQLLVADKTGDVYQIQTDTRSAYNTDVLLLGHLSMILDMTLSSDNQLLITSDRDEKIRVSSFPNCYNIHAFCCGHREFVVKLALLPNNILVSGSGDGTVRFWNYRTGKEIYRLSRGEHESQVEAVKSVVCSSGSKPFLAVLYCGCFSVFIYRVQLEPALSCTLSDELRLESEPWDICWDEGEEANLWLFTSTEQKYVRKYKVKAEDGKLSEYEEPLLEAINTQQRKFFQATTDSASLFPILYKRAFDQSAGGAEDEANDNSKRLIDSQSTSTSTQQAGKKLKKN
ncbi:hypothetical protein CHUAL_006184 [Chamberlinius hualienensis]